MKKEALDFITNLRTIYERKVKNCERKMDKYPINTWGYQDAKDMKQELKKRIGYINYIIGKLEEK